MVNCHFVKVGLLGVLLPISYICFYFGLTQPIISIKSVMGGGLQITRSTLQSIQHLYENGFLLPATLILTFSVLVPLVKLATIAKIAFLVYRKKHPQASRLAYHLRVFAKYQLLDTFVALFMVAFLNMEIITTKLEAGFLFYFAFCLGSVISAQTLYSLVHSPDLSVLATRLAARLASQTPLLGVQREATVEVSHSPVKRDWQFLLAASTLIVGVVGALVRPILTVKIAFEGSLVLSKTTLTLGQSFAHLLFPATLSTVGVQLATIFLVTSVIFLPLITISLASRRPMLADLLSDWAMADVAALGLFTLLLSMNSFGVIVAEIPAGLFSGFWLLLMAGMSSLDLTLQCHARAVCYEAQQIVAQIVANHGQTSTVLGAETSSVPTEGEYESEEKARELLAETSASLPTRSKLVAKMSGNVMVMKTVSWSVFFLLWYMQSAEKVLDLNTVNAEIRANLPAVTKALDDALPMSIGNCSAAAAAPSPCEGGDVSLYYNRSSMYEVEARWLSGLKSTRLENVHLSVPKEQVFAVEIEGKFGAIPLSLAIAECFTPDVWITGKCRSIWDNTEACCGKNKGFYVLILADCKAEFPFIRNIKVTKVKVDPITVEESIAGIVKVPLSDVTDTVEQAIQEALGPTLDRPFIPWGDKNMTLADLINRILLLNVGDNFSCPKPLL